MKTSCTVDWITNFCLTQEREKCELLAKFNVSVKKQEVGLIYLASAACKLNSCIT